METQYSLLIDTNTDKENEPLLRRIYELLMPSDVAINSETKTFLTNNSLSKTIGDKHLRFRFIENFINDKKSIEIFLKTEPDSTIIFKIKETLQSIKEITGYRLMTMQTKIKIEINPI